MFQTVLVTVLCAILGMFVFSAVGMTLGCAVIWPNANLCGVPGAIYGGSLGLIVGAIMGSTIAWSATRSA